MKFDNNEICSIFPIDSLVFYVWDQNFDFLRKMDWFWANILYVQEFFFPNHFKKPVFMFMRNYKNSSVRNCLKIFTFRPYEFDYLGFLTITRRAAMRSKAQWDLYMELLMSQTTKSPIWGNHWVPLGYRAHLGSVNQKYLFLYQLTHNMTKDCP